MSRDTKGKLRHEMGEFVSYADKLVKPRCCLFITQKSKTDEDAVGDDDATVDSIDDIPSRTKLKMTSEMHVETQRQEEFKKRKKRIKPKASPDDDVIQTATEQQATTKLLNLTSPPRSRPKAHNSKEDPMDRVQHCLTEMPCLP